MASFRTTATSLLGTVSTSADVITKTVGTASIGVDMLNRWATNEADKQKANLKYDTLLVEKEAKHRVLTRISDMNMEIATYQAKSPAHSAAYEAAANELESLLAS